MHGLVLLWLWSAALASSASAFARPKTNIYPEHQSARSTTTLAVARKNRYRYDRTIFNGGGDRNDSGSSGLGDGGFGDQDYRPEFEELENFEPPYDDYEPPYDDYEPPYDDYYYDERQDGEIPSARRAQQQPHRRLELDRKPRWRQAGGQGRAYMGASSSEEFRRGPDNQRLLREGTKRGMSVGGSGIPTLGHGRTPKNSHYNRGAPQFDDARELRDLQQFRQESREQQNRERQFYNARRESYGSPMGGYPDSNQRNYRYDGASVLPQMYDEEDQDLTTDFQTTDGWRPPRENRVDDFRTMQGRERQQRNREIAFGSRRKKPSSIGDNAPSLYAKESNLPSDRLRQRGRRYDNQQPPLSSQTSYGENNRDFRRRGERITQQKGEREIAFGPNSRQYYQSNYYDDRQRQVRETKSTTFGQSRYGQQSLDGSRGMPPRPPEQAPPQGEVSRSSDDRPPPSNEVRPPSPPQPQKQSQRLRPPDRSPREQMSYGENVPRQGKMLKRFQKQQKTRRRSVNRGMQRQKKQQQQQSVPDYEPLQQEELQRQTAKSNKDGTNGGDKFDQGVETVRKFAERIGFVGRKKNDNSLTVEERTSEEKISNALLGDAQTLIRDVLGDKISVGEACSRSYSSTMVDGVTRSSIQISFPVDCSFRAWGTLLGNQDGITRLDVDLGRRGIINVPVDRKEEVDRTEEERLDGSKFYSEDIKR